MYHKRSPIYSYEIGVLCTDKRQKTISLSLLSLIAMKILPTAKKNVLNPNSTNR